MSETMEAEYKRLQAMLAARNEKSGYAANVVAIKARMAELEKDMNRAG